MNLKRVKRIMDAKADISELREILNEKFPPLLNQLGDYDDDISNLVVWSPLDTPEDLLEGKVGNEFVLREDKFECSGDIIWDGEIYHVTEAVSEYDEESELWIDAVGELPESVALLSDLIGEATELTEDEIPPIYEVLSNFKVI